MSENFENVVKKKVGLVSIVDLIGEKFYIPSYQRGYRWSTLEVEALLDDIIEFKEGRVGQFYCLQPLVVKKGKCKISNLEEVCWRVIDGQQRLTTIYLALKFLREEKKIECGKFDIKYERETDIDKCKDTSLENDSIELFYLKSNYKNIRNWRGWNDNIGQTILNQTKFIWYDIELDDNADEYTVFSNLNSGKIPLTNAELVKALFLKNVDNNLKKELRQDLIAEEYDQIERKLREPEFWYFLNGRKAQPSSCINFLFELMYETDQALYDEKGEPTKQKRSFENVGANKIFYYFERKTYYDINNKRVLCEQQFKNVKEVWKDVLKYFHILEGWYANAEIYNLIGYLRSVGFDIRHIYNEYLQSSDKDVFKTELKNLCYRQICGEGEVNKIESFEFIKELRYDENKDLVIKVLLLANIATLNLCIAKEKDHINEVTKFSFASYHQCNWNVEHISPDNAIWYDELDDWAKNQDEAIVKKLSESKKGGKMLKELNPPDDLDKFVCVKNNSIMTLPNLTLLNEHDNKSVSNKSFKKKRKSILDFHGRGSFVPPCTFMVFTKGYSELDKDKLDFWSDIDRDNYINHLCDILKQYFKD